MHVIDGRLIAATNQRLNQSLVCHHHDCDRATITIATIDGSTVPVCTDHHPMWMR